MKRKLHLIVLALLCHVVLIQAQTVWNGSGDGSSWSDAQNWEGGAVPIAGALVEIGGDVTVTGMVAEMPGQVKIKANSNVVLDLNMTIGNGTLEEHTVIINANSSLSLGTTENNRTITINCHPDKHGIAIFGGSDNSSLTIVEGSTLDIMQARFGINVSNTLSTLLNAGTIKIGSGVQDGIKSAATSTNTGVINIDNVSGDGILGSGGTFDNETTGTIIITKPADDGIDLRAGTIFSNKGTLNITAADAATAGNNGISAGTAEETGSFVNESDNLSVSGGISADGRAVYVYDMGDFTNNGLLTLDGGNSGSRLFVKGVFDNTKGAMVDLLDGRFNVNETGILTNNGMFKTTRDGSGGFTTGTVVNNAFFDYENSNNFAVGMGMITDEGISVNDSSDIFIDAMESCTVKLANASYDWYEEGTLIETSGVDGMLTFPAASLMNDPVELTTDYEGVLITVLNYCEEAFGGVINQLDPVNIEPLKVFPTLVQFGESLNLDLSALGGQNMQVDIVNMYGQILSSNRLPSGQVHRISVNALPVGQYILRGYQGEQVFVGRFCVVQ